MEVNWFVGSIFFKVSSFVSIVTRILDSAFGLRSYRLHNTPEILTDNKSTTFFWISRIFPNFFPTLLKRLK